MGPQIRMGKGRTDMIDNVVVHQVLHRPQNKEKPMQNNFDSPVRVTQNDFRV